MNRQQRLEDEQRLEEYLLKMEKQVEQGQKIRNSLQQIISQEKQIESQRKVKYEFNGK